MTCREYFFLAYTFSAEKFLAKDFSLLFHFFSISVDNLIGAPIYISLQSNM